MPCAAWWGYTGTRDATLLTLRTAARTWLPGARRAPRLTDRLAYVRSVNQVLGRRSVVAHRRARGDRSRYTQRTHDRQRVIVSHGGGGLGSNRLGCVHRSDECRVAVTGTRLGRRPMAVEHGAPHSCTWRGIKRWTLYLLNKKLLTRGVSVWMSGTP